MPFSPQTTEIRLNNLKGQNTMTKAQHTPGPWKLAGYDKGKSIYEDVHFGNDKQDTICRLFFHEIPIADEQVRANARLIAAAPELLEALYDVMQCFVGDDENKVAQRARAAIAKATGE